MNTRILAIHLKEKPNQKDIPELARMLLQFSPSIGIRPTDMLYVDLTKSSHLFKSEEDVLKRLLHFFEQKEIKASMILSNDVISAGALALQQPGGYQIIQKSLREEAIHPLNTSSLYFIASPFSPIHPIEKKNVSNIINILSLLGIHRLKDFTRLPSSLIGPRFGELGVELHRRIRDAVSIPFRPFRISESFRESVEFEDSISSVEPLLFSTKSLLEKLEERLQKKLQAALEIKIFIETEDCQEIESSISLSRPLRRKKALFPIIRERLFQIQLDAPILSFSIEVTAPMLSRGAQFHLFHSTEEQQEQLDELLGRLVAGLGPVVISAAKLREEYQPERSWSAEVFNPFHKTKEQPSLHKEGERPTVLLTPPTPLHAKTEQNQMMLSSKKELHHIKTLNGPERISGDWGSGSPLSRDYFIAHSKSGQQLWIFKDRKSKSYFLHGYFD